MVEINTSLQHHFLIAMPSLVDTFFYRTVIYICEHDDQGAMGIIINRPTQITLTELLSHFEISNSSKTSNNTPVFFGGPVEKNQGMVLHNSNTAWKNTIQLAEQLFLTSSSDILNVMGTEEAPEHSMVALGYSSWAAGQLEQEIAENSWLTVAADNDILFNTPADKQWHAAAKLLGIDINLMPNTTGHA